MLDSIIQKIAVVIAARVADEVLKRLPDITGAVIEVLPEIVEQIVDQILDHLPFPFKRTP